MVTTRRPALYRVLVAVALFSLILQPTAGQARPSDPPEVQNTGEGARVIRLYVRDKAHLDAVAGSLDIWEAHREEGYVVAAVTAEQQAWLEGLGYTMTIDTIKTGWLLGTLAPLDPRFHYNDPISYSNTYGRYITTFLSGIADSYPDLTELIDIGNTWQDARDLWVLRVSNEDPAFGAIADKPAFFLYATVHAREVATPELAIRYIKYLLQGYNGEGGYGVDPDATWLVDRHVLYVLVMTNPDGHVVNEANTSANRRKNMNNVLCPSGNFGIDLNRNHSFMWGCCGGSSSYPCDDTYRGQTRASEPETQAFQAYFATVMRDQNGPNGDDEIPLASPEDAMGLFISLHSYSDLVLWPWGFDDDWYGPSPNFAQLEAIGRKFTYFNGYNPDGSIWYDVDGATDDWTYGKFGIASFTFEVGPNDYSACSGFFPAYGCIEGTDGMTRNFWAENQPAFVYAHKIAATPYRTVYGPDTLSVSVTPTTTTEGLPVTLQATITDRRYGNAGLVPVNAAEYFVDAPGADGTGIAMAPGDGTWGGTSEGVQATLDTSALVPGRHLVFVHGRNSQGKWGPFTATFLTIEAAPPPCVPVTGATLTALTPSPVYTDTVVHFEAALTPMNFTRPYTYSLALDGNPGIPASGNTNPLTGLSATFDSTGPHTATLTVWNCGTDPSGAVTATATVDVTPRPITTTYGITLSPLLAERSSFPNATVVYTLTAQNTGNVSTTFDFATTGEEVWLTTVTPTMQALAAGASAVLSVTVTLDFDVVGTDVVTVTATSRTSIPVAAQAVLRTTALPWKRLYLPVILAQP